LSISEFCYHPEHAAAVLPLLDAILTFAAKRRHSGIQGYLPEDHPALPLVRERPGFTTMESSVLLFRLVNLRRLLERLRPLLAERARGAGVERTFTLAVGEQAAGLRVRPGWVAVEAEAGERTELA